MDLARRAVLTACVMGGVVACRGGDSGPRQGDDGADDDLPLEVATDQGSVRGAMTGPDRAVIAFKGIPYAAPPLGPLRWRGPERHAGWDGVLDATAFGSDCTQTDSATQAIVGDEDCLFLNVWAPARRAEGGSPVLVHIHGGDNIIGAGSLAVLDGARLAARGPAVVVTINYRLGPFGFLAHPALADPGDGSAGNYALLDQIAALAWVQRNIAEFGGDPERVLLFGQSAGAVNTCALVASPLAAGLFSAAMMQSGACDTLPDDLVAQTAAAALDSLGCTGADDVAACLRSRPARDVASVPGAGSSDVSIGAKFYPHRDGRVLPEPALDRIRAGDHNVVPLVFGTTADEYIGILEQFVTLPLTTEDEYVAAVNATFGAGAPFILALYPVADYASPYHALAAAFGDLAQHCPARRAARAAAATGSAPVRRFLFTQAFADPRLQPFGASHGFDLPFFFDNFSAFDVTPTPAEQTLSDRMMDAAIELAATGDPGSVGGVAWPRYLGDADDHILLATEIGTGQGVRTTHCDLWDAADPD